MKEELHEETGKKIIWDINHVGEGNFIVKVDGMKFYGRVYFCEYYKNFVLLDCKGRGSSVDIGNFIDTFREMMKNN